jgi:hypothetical protein
VSEILEEPASDQLQAIEAFLASHGAEGMPHPGGTLLQHLVRVREQLATWHCSIDIQLAGLCHAAYGTDGFAPSLLDLADRAMLADLIGARAEHLVYLYASCDRQTTYPRLGTPQRPQFRDRFTGTDFDPSHEDLRAFVAITAANEIDVFEHNEELKRQHAEAFFRFLERIDFNLHLRKSTRQGQTPQTPRHPDTP